VGNPIASANILTTAPSKQRKIDGESPNIGQDIGSANRQVSTPQQVDLGRARRRLDSEVGGMSATRIASSAQARELAGRLVAQLASDPKAGMKAHGDLDLKLFAAATAPPSA
jgi:hypothetical protein